MTQGPYDPSSDRQDLDRLAEEFSMIICAFSDHGPMVRGSFRRLLRRCGKERCRCCRGKLHESLVFIEWDGGRRRVRKTTIGKEQALRKPVKRYERLRRLRARLSKIHAEALRLCDRLCEHRLEEGNRILSRWNKADP